MEQGSPCTQPPSSDLQDVLCRSSAVCPGTGAGSGHSSWHGWQPGKSQRGHLCRSAWALWRLLTLLLEAFFSAVIDCSKCDLLKMMVKCIDVSVCVYVLLYIDDAKRVSRRIIDMSCIVVATSTLWSLEWAQLWQKQLSCVQRSVSAWTYVYQAICVHVYF